MEKAARAVDELPGLDRCADVVSLRASVALPQDAESQRKVSQAQAELAAAAALEATGRRAEALTRAKGALELARTVSYPPLLAESLLIVGGLQLNLEEVAQAEPLLHEAAWTAQAAKSDVLAAQTFDLGVVARRLACRGAQPYTGHITTHRLAFDYLAAQFAHRQLARRQHAIPVQHAILQRLGQAGEQLAMVQLGAVLPHPPLHQQGGADMAVAIAAALRAVVAKAPGGIQDALAGSNLQHRAGGLQGHFHRSSRRSALMADAGRRRTGACRVNQSISRLAQSSSTRRLTASS